MARKSEMMDAIEALAKAKDISVDQIMEAVEDGLKAAYRRDVKRSANAQMKPRRSAPTTSWAILWRST